MRKTVALLTLFIYLLAGPANGLAEYVCGQDLDGDGYADGAGEAAECLPAGADWFCPVAAVVCEDGCPPGYAADAPSGRCLAAPGCAPGEEYDPALDRCASEVTTSYPANRITITGGPYTYGDNYLIYAGIQGEGVLRWWSRKWRGTFDTAFTGGVGFEAFQGPSAGGTSPVTRLVRNDPRTIEFYMYGSYLECGDGECVNRDYSGLLETLRVSGAEVRLFNAAGVEVTTLTLGNAGTGHLVRSLEAAGNEIRFFGGGEWRFNPLGKMAFETTVPCPQGGVLNGDACLVASKVVTDAACPPPGALDPALDRCEAAAAPVCPLGSQFPCLANGAGSLQCSPNPCFDLAAPGGEVELLPPDDPMLQNDGPVDEEGNCLGELFIFSGKASRCRPPGITVGTSNNCCSSDEPALTDSTSGPRVNQVVTAVQTVYEAAQVGYYAYQISTGAMAAVEVGGQVVVYNMATGSVAASYGAGSAVGTGVAAAQGAAAGGAAASGTVGSALTSYMGALFNPTTIIIAIVVLVVMKVLMGSGCDQRDIETALLDDSGYCHYVGSTCEKKWGMAGCVQRAKRFCCFNSKLARIIHEQGRPQLASFGPTGDWGLPESPNCRGFTPEEFQMLDFAKIDLSEYYGDIQKELTLKVEEAQGEVEEKIRQHYENLR